METTITKRVKLQVGDFVRIVKLIPPFNTVQPAGWLNRVGRIIAIDNNRKLTFPYVLALASSSPSQSLARFSGKEIKRLPKKEIVLWQLRIPK